MKSKNENREREREIQLALEREIEQKKQGSERFDNLTNMLKKINAGLSQKLRTKKIKGNKMCLKNQQV